MAKLPTISTLTGSFGSQSAINTSLQALRSAFTNTLSRDGSSPNQMEADIDLNSNDLLNVNMLSVEELRVNGEVFNPAAAVSIPDWEGAWQTATSYAVNDLVQQNGNTYICIVAHTSGTFATDLGANKWELFVEKGASGAGSGDLVAANNLSDVDDAATARANLDLAIGTDVQAYSDVLDSIADLDGGFAADNYFYGTGADTVGIGTITAQGRALLDDTTAAAQRATMQVPYQRPTAFSGNLNDLSAAGIFTEIVPLTTGVTNHWNVSDDGDFVLHFNFDANNAIQFGLEDNGYTNRRQKVDGSWQSWFGFATFQLMYGGADQDWVDVSGSRAHSTIYQNTTALPIAVNIVATSATNRDVQVSNDNFSANSVTVGVVDDSGDNVNISFTVPSTHYYRINGACTVVEWAELRGTI